MIVRASLQPLSNEFENWDCSLSARQMPLPPIEHDEIQLIAWMAVDHD